MIENTNFPADIGREESDRVFIPIIHYPTVLVLPMLFPASVYSSRSSDTDGLYRLRMHNINASKRNLEQYEIGTLSTQAIDTVRFCQMIAKIGVTYAASKFDPRTFSPDLMQLITADMPNGTAQASHYNRVGCIWDSQDSATSDLHQLELGTIDWLGQSMLAVKVRLFACYEMPSYFVALN
ncbi:hypothetical protein [Mesorhizobium sp. M0701]|uniref:hypothetical protein n=1 Tax=Mesorhizobium sp. M0701 TaxID=2956989 RepID=UPI003335A1FF